MAGFRVLTFGHLVAVLSKEERAAQLERWKQRTSYDDAAVRSYVKHRADELLEWECDPPDAASVAGGWHPAVAVKAQAQTWVKQWNRPFTPDGALLDAVFAEVPRPQDVCFPSRFTLETCGSLCGS